MKRSLNRMFSLMGICGVLGGVLLCLPVVWGEDDSSDFPTVEAAVTESVVAEPTVADITVETEPVETEQVALEEKMEDDSELSEPAEPKDEETEDSSLLLTADLLLPETSCAYVTIRDFVHFHKTWEETVLGKLMATPEMQAVVKDLGKQVQGYFEKVRSRLGVTLEDIRQIAAGEISVGVLLTSEQKYAVVTIIDVRNHQVETQKVLARVSERVVDEGGKQTKQMISDAEVYFLDIPDKDNANVIHKAIYVLKDNLLIASDDREVIQGILKRFVSLKLGKEELPCLADVDGYLNVLENCMTGEMLPDVIWYVDPIRYAMVQRIVAKERNPMNVRGHSVADMLTESGFNGIEAIGGVVTLKSEGYDAVHRTFISIPKEPEKSLKMLRFPESDHFEIPEWVSATAGTIHSVNIDFLNVFDNMGPMFNQFFGEGDSGVWEDVLAGLQEDPYGPQIDLRKDLFSCFENHLIFIVQNDRPKDVDGERRLVAIPLKDEEKVRESMGKLISEEPTIETLELPNGDVVWYAVQEEETEVEEDPENPRRESIFPEMAITVWNGYLIIVSHKDFLDTIKKFDPEKDPQLKNDPNYQLVEKELNAFAGTSRGSIHYFNTARNSEHLYEMFRTGKVPQSTSLEAKRINSMFASGTSKKQEPRKAVFDGSSLPKFDDIRSSFLPAGATILTKEKGFLFMGFWLSEEKAKSLVEAADETVDETVDEEEAPVKTSSKVKKVKLQEEE